MKMKKRINLTLVALVLAAAITGAQEAPGAEPDFDAVADSLQADLAQSIAELNELRAVMVEQKVPLAMELSHLEDEWLQLRGEFQSTSRDLDDRLLELNNLRSDIEQRRAETDYLSNLLADYTRNFEARLHVAEFDRYEVALERARLAPENTDLNDEEIFARQAEILSVSISRLEEALGGASFKGTAVDSDGLVQSGAFVLVGPMALFLSEDGEHVGIAEQPLLSNEPSIVPFGEVEDGAAAKALASDGEGYFPIDPTLGNAHKIEATHESFIEHVQKGGVVMIPIFAMAVAALLVAVGKWISLTFMRRPSKKEVARLLESIDVADVESARERSNGLKGPAGQMLRAGVHHMRDPRDLIEEVMYEIVLKTRLRLQRFLPFVAICAASAPLLGLLGTVTGIINTFKLITVFGSGDVKSLSGGISEALITTKFGLIVAIPSLLLHAFLSRKARALVGEMEAHAIAFVNRISKAPALRPYRAAPRDSVQASHSAPDPELVRAQVSEILSDLLGPLVDERSQGGASQAATSAGS